MFSNTFSPRIWIMFTFLMTKCKPCCTLGNMILNPSIYNIIRWVAWTMGQTNCRPSVWCSKYYFFSWFLAKFFAKILSIYFLIFFYKITKIKIKSFECPKSIESLKNNNTWNIRLLVDDSFVPSSKQPRVIYCRLTDFNPHDFNGGSCRHLSRVLKLANKKV